MKLSHLLLAVMILVVPLASQAWDFPDSPDGKYRAEKLYENGVHYKIVEKATSKTVLITHAQYETANDVKAGKFSDDSKKFAAAYHYGHTHSTWIGIWSLTTGKLINTITLSGYQRNIPDEAFKQ